MKILIMCEGPNELKIINLLLDNGKNHITFTPKIKDNPLIISKLPRHVPGRKRDKNYKKRTYKFS